MNIEEFKKYVDEMCKNIKGKLEEDTEEFDFFLLLANTFNETCNRNRKLENALDEIEIKLQNETLLVEDEIDRLMEIIKKAKGE